jgi:hypothetical protein
MNVVTVYRPTIGDIRRYPALRRREAFVDELGDDLNDAAATLVTEFNGSRCQSEQGVVVAAAHVVTGVKVGSALTNDDFASLHHLTAEALHAEVLGV